MAIRRALRRNSRFGARIVQLQSACASSFTLVSNRSLKTAHRSFPSFLKVPPYTLIFLTVSKRIHSLYVLRLFNDCIAMFFLYAALWMYTRDTRDKTGRDGRWILGTCLFRSVHRVSGGSHRVLN